MFFAYKFSKIFTKIKVNYITLDREKQVFECSMYRVVYGILSSFLGIRIEGEDGTSSTLLWKGYKCKYLVETHAHLFKWKETTFLKTRSVC